MKSIFLAFCGLLFIGVNASPRLDGEAAFKLNAQCAHGPVYWCKNLMNAKSCGAVTHCIQTVWEKQTYPVDTDSVCQICLDMVKQARDQLRSNETQADLKAVFEGTCEFIRIKKARQECDKLADDFVPELVEALSSQMNPQVVCSVAGLCNNAEIDKELEKASTMVVVDKFVPSELTCDQCMDVSDLISNKFGSMHRDQVLDNILQVCGTMSSFSDACSSLALAYFNDVYAHLKDNLNAENICHMSGVCSAQFHQHDDGIELTIDSVSGIIRPRGDDVPCDLCKQLITHLRDVLVANTTEAEFKKVLEGVCKQTKTFKSECLSLADQYYDVIYQKLTSDLDPENACFMIGICPKSGLAAQPQSYQVMPLVPSKQLLVKKKLLGEGEPVLSAAEIQSFQLPKDVLLLEPQQIEAQLVSKKSNQFCTLCEFFLHFVQNALAQPQTEENIKDTVLKICNKVPAEFQGQCQNFINTYSDAIIALLIQDLDPSQVCPLLDVCSTETVNENEKCPICLFLVQDLEELIKKDRSKENIERKLSVLCEHLKADLKAECLDFVNTYTAELVDKLASDFSPQQLCLYLKCCTEKEEVRIEHLGDKASSSEYISNSVYQIEPEKISAPECILCEQLVKEVEKKVTKDKSREHIKKVLEEACSAFPKAKLKNKCLAAIEKNTDLIVNLILKEVTPKEVCTVLGFCMGNAIEKEIAVKLENDKKDKPTCRLCQIVASKIEEALNNKTAQQDIENCIKHVCDGFPSKLKADCQQFVQDYADEITKHFPSGSPKELCKKLCVCEGDEVEEPIEDDGFDNPECMLCEQLVKEVEKKAKTNDTKEHIKEVLEQACGSFHKKQLKEKCIEVVDQNADYIVNAIIKQTSPKEICHGLGFCGASQDSGAEETKELAKIAEVLMEKFSETPQCVLCELIMTKLEANLKKNATQVEIENSIRKICSSLPAKLSLKCKKFVEDYADLVISLISTVPPKELCGELNFCRANLLKDTAQRDVMECAICNTALDAYITVFNKNGPKDRKTLISVTCNLMPAKYHKKCVDFMSIYLESLTNMIRANEPKSQMCVSIGQCFNDGNNDMFVEISRGMQSRNEEAESDESSESKESHEVKPPTKKLVGSKKCTFGPSYWCSSPERMEECNAHHFCKSRSYQSP